MALERVISGGQTGVDRAALDVAMKIGIDCGGWVPKGRFAEDGPLDISYPVQEMQTRSRSARTEKNIMDSDGTLVIFNHKADGGTALTIVLADVNQRPLCEIDLGSTSMEEALQTSLAWIAANDIKVLNVAGPRKSKDPTIYETATAFLSLLFCMPEQT